MTPMLDLVMQLLMYFILCANFLGQEVSDELVKLPNSAAAIPQDKKGGDYLVVLVTANKQRPIILPPDVRADDKLDLDAFEVKLADKAKYAPKDPQTKHILTTVVLRIDKDADYGLVYDVMNICKRKDFRNFNTRLIIQ